MPFLTFMRWLVDSVEYCDITNKWLYKLPDDLQSHLSALGEYIKLWFNCSS